MIIDNIKINHFSLDEFPENPLKYADPKLIISLDRLRELINLPIHPSPVKNALARFDGSKTSRHYAVGRLSDAIDVFIIGNKLEIFLKIIQSNLFTGIGLYFDTHYRGNSQMMVHLDLREKPLMWYRDIEYNYCINSEFYKKIHRYLGD